jgi:hypothetical protein
VLQHGQHDDVVELRVGQGQRLRDIGADDGPAPGSGSMYLIV